MMLEQPDSLPNIIARVIRLIDRARHPAPAGPRLKPDEHPNVAECFDLYSGSYNDPR